MPASPRAWRNRSPGDLSIELNEVCAGDVNAVIEAAVGASQAWRRAPLVEKIARMKAVQQDIAAAKDRLARGIAIETGKPLTESLGEVGAVIAKIDLTIEDAKRWLAEENCVGGPHAAIVRRRARGPAAVIAPFNFPLHLGHGANVAHLLAGNPVIFKPSPLCANVVRVSTICVALMWNFRLGFSPASPASPAPGKARSFTTCSTGICSAKRVSLPMRRRARVEKSRARRRLITS